MALFYQKGGDTHPASLLKVDETTLQDRKEEGGHRLDKQLVDAVLKKMMTLHSQRTYLYKVRQRRIQHGQIGQKSPQIWNCPLHRSL